MDDIYKPRFTNGGDEPLLSEGSDRVIHPVGTHGNNATIPCTAGVTSSTSDQERNDVEVVTEAAPDCGYTISFQDGGDEPSGDAEAARLGKQNVVNATLPSPTHTREELVEVIATVDRTVTRNGIQLSIPSSSSIPSSLLCSDATIDALIAIGAVRVK